MGWPLGRAIASPSAFRFSPRVRALYTSPAAIAAATMSIGGLGTARGGAAGPTKKGRRKTAMENLAFFGKHSMNCSYVGHRTGTVIGHPTSNCFFILSLHSSSWFFPKPFSANARDQRHPCKTRFIAQYTHVKNKDMLRMPSSVAALADWYAFLSSTLYLKKSMGVKRLQEPCHFGRDDDRSNVCCNAGCYYTVCEMHPASI